MPKYEVPVQNISKLEVTKLQDYNLAVAGVPAAGDSTLVIDIGEVNFAALMSLLAFKGRDETPTLVLDVSEPEIGAGDDFYTAVLNSLSVQA